MRLSTTRRIQRIRQKSAEAMLLAARIAVEQETFAVRYLGHGSLLKVLQNLGDGLHADQECHIGRDNRN
jgi:hypothetical protein